MRDKAMKTGKAVVLDADDPLAKQAFAKSTT
jgi:hypothetical protein